MRENFPWNYILTLRNKSNNILSIMNEETAENELTGNYGQSLISGSGSVPLPYDDKIIRKKAKISVKE